MSETNEEKLIVEMQPIGRRIEISPGASLLEASRTAGVGLVSLCGGDGWCESCRVRVSDGKVNHPTETEKNRLGDDELAAGMRLACQTVPLSDIQIDIPLESLTTPQRLQVEGLGFDIPFKPSIEIVDLELSPPNLADLRSDCIIRGKTSINSKNIVQRFRN